jgi:succinate dehydrogenase / fumarate reductase cytochrome b subunit
MAVTGVILFGFAIVHMLGNLQVFLGPAYMNHYAEFLHSMPELLWPTRMLLLGALVLHIASFVKLQRVTVAARPVGYRSLVPQQSTWASRGMRLSGLLVLAYLVFHILHMAVGAFHPTLPHALQDGPFGTPDAYGNLVKGLGVGWVGVVYVVCNALLGMHLWHGAYSVCRTLGLSGGRQLALARTIATVLSVGVAGGNVLIATSILLGLVK